MRLHLFEWEDQHWLPAFFRNYITDHLRYGLSQKMMDPVNQAIAGKIKPLVDRAGSNRIVDLCSGGGGPLLNVRRVLAEEMDTPVEVVLTDLFPNTETFQKSEATGGGVVKARYESISAFDVPSDLHGVRTMFTALHHFRPKEVQRLLADAAHKSQPIAAFEPFERTLHSFVLMAMRTLFNAIVLTPVVGPLTLQRFVLTYLIPLAPLVMLWDGLVSVLRAYTPGELQALANEIGAGSYTWEARRCDLPGPMGVKLPMVYLVGCPNVAA